MTGNKLKILLIEPVLPHYRKDVFKILSKYNGFEIFYLAGEKYQNIESISIENSTLSCHYTFTLFKHRFYFLKQAFSNVNRINPDIIVCTGIDFHLIHTILIFIWYRITKRKEFIWWSHATEGRQGKIGYIIRKFFYRRSSGVMAYGLKGKDVLLTMGINKRKIAIVNNSINSADYGFFNYKLNDNKKEKRLTLLYCGRIRSEKKVDLLINALGLLENEGYKDFICYIIGDGKTMKLKQLAVNNKVKDKVIFTGAKYGIDNHKYFLESDLFINPGGIGLAIVQAFSFGLPVITTDNICEQGPEIELLIPGINGDTFKNNSAEELADRIIYWKDQLKLQGDKIMYNCINQIKEMEYLPEKQSEKVIDFIMKYAVK